MRRFALALGTTLALTTACSRDGGGAVPTSSKEKAGEVEVLEPPAPAPAPAPSPAPPPPAADEVADRADDAATIELPRREIPLSEMREAYAELEPLLRRHCPKLSLRAPRGYALEQLRELGDPISAWGRGGELVVSWTTLDGVGMYDFSTTTTTVVYDLRSCVTSEVESNWRGRLVTGHFGTAGRSVFPSELRSILGEEADCDDPRHGFACMVLRLPQSCESLDPRPAGGRRWDLLPITKTPSPWVDLPRAEQVRTHWTKAKFWGHGGRPIPRGDPNYPISDSNSVDPPEAPRLVRKVGRYRFYEAMMPIKGEGVAFLMRDDMKERHRWIGHTRECLLANSVEWLAAGEHLVVGWAEHSGAGPLPDGLNGLFVVDLREAVIYLLRVDELAARLGGVGSFWWRDVYEDEDEDEEEDEDEDGGPDWDDKLFELDDRTLVFESGLHITLGDLRAVVDTF